MPLPSIAKYGAKQCTANSRRTGLPCNNPAAHGCKTCRMHGARKPHLIKRGKDHPNYIHGNRTKEAMQIASESSLRLSYLEDLACIVSRGTIKRTSGRKPANYVAVGSIAVLIEKTK